MTAIARPRPARAAGPVDCAPWCAYSDGHPEELYREDQWCFTDQLVRTCRLSRRSSDHCESAPSGRGCTALGNRTATLSSSWPTKTGRGSR